MADDGTHPYWANAFGSTIGEANLNGKNINEKFITGVSRPNGVAASG